MKNCIYIVALFISVSEAVCAHVVDELDSDSPNEFLINKKFENPNYCGLNAQAEKECADYRKRKHAWNKKQGDL